MNLLIFQLILQNHFYSMFSLFKDLDFIWEYSLKLLHNFLCVNTL